MILPIYALGNPILKRLSDPIDRNYPNISQIISDMIETMKYTNGVGLSAPQIGHSIKLFVIDSSLGMSDKVFINPIISKESKENISLEEGCLSIPSIRGYIPRSSRITVHYQDENFISHKDEFDGMISRVIQHEYDHLIGVLILDHLSKYKLLSLEEDIRSIETGQINIKYPMKFNERVN